MKINVKYEEGKGMPMMAVLPDEVPMAYRNFDGQWFMRWVKVINITYMPF